MFPTLNSRCFKRQAPRFFNLSLALYAKNLLVLRTVLADLTLHMRDSVNRLQRVQQRDIGNEDQWCVEYEEGIRSVGGIDAGSKTFAVYEKVLLSWFGARRP